MEKVVEETKLRKILGNHLKEIREQNKINQHDLAELFNVHEKSLSRAENGHNSASFYLVYQYARYFGVTVDYLLDEGTRSTSQARLLGAILRNEINDETCDILLQIAKLLEKE